MVSLCFPRVDGSVLANPGCDDFVELTVARNNIGCAKQPTMCYSGTENNGLIGKNPIYLPF